MFRFFLPRVRHFFGTGTLETHLRFLLDPVVVMNANMRHMIVIRLMLMRSNLTRSNIPDSPMRFSGHKV